MPKFDAAEVAKKFNDEIQAGVATAKAAADTERRSRCSGIGFLDARAKAGGRACTAAGVYVRMTQRACEKTGVAFELRRVARVDIEAAVIAANKEARVRGIIIYYPIFGGPIDDYLRDVIGLEKDVEGLNHRYRYSLYHNIRTIDNDAGKKCVLPCTPLAVIKIMEYLGAYDRTRPVGHQLDGKVAVVFNRSEVVGRPLAAMLANDGATVYSIDISGMLVYAARAALSHRAQTARARRRGGEPTAHRRPPARSRRYTRGSVAGTIRVAETTAERKEVLARADLLVTAVPLPPEKFVVKASELKKGVIAINLAQHANLEPAVADVGTLVPAIGKVTIAMLQRNLLRLHDNFDPHGRCMSPPLRATPGADLDEADASGKRARARTAAAAAALGVAALGALAIAARRRSRSFLKRGD